jgi:hypothetical protein
MSPSIVSGDCIPTISIEEVENDDAKGDWVALDEVQLVDMFSSVILTNQEEEELGNEFAFHETRDEMYYMEKFPGFSNEVYSILAKEQKKLDDEKKPKNELVNEVVNDDVKNQIVGSNLFHIFPF